MCSRVQRRRLPQGLARDVSIASPLAIEMNNCRLSSPRDESFLARSGIPLSLPYSEGEGVFTDPDLLNDTSLLRAAPVEQKKASKSRQNRLCWVHFAKSPGLGRHPPFVVIDKQEECDVHVHTCGANGRGSITSPKTQNCHRV